MKIETENSLQVEAAAKVAVKEIIGERVISSAPIGQSIDYLGYEGIASRVRLLQRKATTNTTLGYAFVVFAFLVSWVALIIVIPNSANHILRLMTALLATASVLLSLSILAFYHSKCAALLRLEAELARETQRAAYMVSVEYPS